MEYVNRRIYIRRYSSSPRKKKEWIKEIKEKLQGIAEARVAHSLVRPTLQPRHSTAEMSVRRPIVA